MLLLGVVFTTSTFIGCLYQITTVSSSELPVVRLAKFCIEFLGIGAEIYYLCYCSECLDNCNGTLRRALARSNWVMSSKRVRKALSLLLLKVQGQNYVCFRSHFLLINNALLVKIFKFSFTFVNFMRLKSKC